MELLKQNEAGDWEYCGPKDAEFTVTPQRFDHIFYFGGRVQRKAWAGQKLKASEIDPGSLVLNLRHHNLKLIEPREEGILDMTGEIGLRCRYHRFLSEPGTNPLTFEEWVDKHARVPTNPATYEAKGIDL